MAQLNLSFGGSVAIKEEFAKIWLKRAAGGAQDGAAVGGPPDAEVGAEAGLPPVSPARRKELILEKKAKKEAAAALKQERDPFAHYFGVTAHKADGAAGSSAQEQASLAGGSAGRKVNFAEPSSGAASCSQGFGSTAGL